MIKTEQIKVLNFFIGSLQGYVQNRSNVPKNTPKMKRLDRYVGTFQISKIGRVARSLHSR
jgi:hypothetical protein